ncbi:MAG: DUF2314 domain-containing protein [Anaerolineaceae bacterium]|nr:DUF2314 domain-containing protein [Anaerolineaceae bacterium]MBN2677950.1 DUF2314 domain-containing protein [Anaerolineaceae bacterium]
MATELIVLVLFIGVIALFISVNRNRAKRTSDLRNLQFVSSNDAAMNAAIQRAKETLPLFIAELSHPKPTQTNFSVKAMLPYGLGNSTEHIWLDGVTYDGTIFMGKLANEPILAKGMHLHDLITIKPDYVSDWMIVDKDRLLGGFTLHVLIKNMTDEEKKKYEVTSGYTIGEEAELP